MPLRDINTVSGAGILNTIKRRPTQNPAVRGIVLILDEPYWWKTRPNAQEMLEPYTDNSHPLMAGTRRCNILSECELERGNPKHNSDAAKSGDELRRLHSTLFKQQSMHRVVSMTGPHPRAY